MGVRRWLIAWLSLPDSSQPAPHPLREGKAGRAPVEPRQGALLAGKTVLVTGAGRNIGRSIALEMTAQGATVWFTDMDPDRCRAVERDLRAANPGARGFVSDVRRPEDNAALVAALRARGAPLDVLVNNVGVDADNFEDTFRTNVFGPMELTAACTGLMIAGGTGGSVIFVTSIHQETVRRVAAYSASKAAVAMVVKELALDLAPHGIRVNGIAPGFVGEDEEGAALPHADTPLGQTSIPPRYIGHAAVYLAADALSRFTTGTILKIDAGLSLVNYFGVSR